MARTRTKAKTKKSRWTEGTSRPERKKRSLVRRLAVGTTKGTGRLIAKGAVTGTRVIRSRGAKQRFEDGYMPEPDEVPAKAWYPGGGGGTCDCGKRFGSDRGLRKHFDVQHNGEEPAERNLGRYHGAAAVRFVRSKDKKAVKTVKRKSATSPSGGRATTSGGRTMGRRGPDVEIEALQLLRRAFEEIEMMGTGGLSKMQAFANGLDIAFGKNGARAFESYRLSLLHKEFPPEVLTGLLKIEELMGDVAKEATRWIEHLEKVLKDDIAAAKRLRGDGPSVGVLAG